MNKKNISEMIFALSGELPGTAVVINQFFTTTELISEFFQWIADNDLPHGVVVGSAKEFGTGRYRPRLGSEEVPQNPSLKGCPLRRVFLLFFSLLHSCIICYNQCVKHNILCLTKAQNTI